MDKEDKELEERFKSLPKDIQIALTSVEVADAIKEISNRYELKLDQESILFDLTADIMMGFSPSKEFIKNFSRQAGIDSETSSAIAKNINEQVFDKVRVSMQAAQKKEEIISATPASDARRDMEALERAGGFSVEPSLASSSADGEEPASDSGDINETDKGDILAGIENPTASPATTAPKIVPKPEESHVEPLVDHLLGNASGQTEQKIVHKTEEPPSPAPKPNNPAPRPAPQPRKGPDPYRESFN